RRRPADQQDDRQHGRRPAEPPPPLPPPRGRRPRGPRPVLLRDRRVSAHGAIVPLHSHATNHLVSSLTEWSVKRKGVPVAEGRRGGHECGNDNNFFMSRGRGRRRRERGERMGEDAITGHYRRAGLEEEILAALRESGLAASVDTLAPVDEFHTGGRRMTASLVDRLDLHPGSRVLD